MGLDVARALAVLGMMAAHLGATYDMEVLRPETWGGLAHGRSSLLFALLAGISISLMTGRTRSPLPESMPGIRLMMLGRGAMIFLIGIVLELLGAPIAVILTVYGFLYIAAIPFLRWRPSRLLLLAGILAVAGPPLLALLQGLTSSNVGPAAELVMFGMYPITVWLALVFAGMAIGRLRLDRVRTVCALLVAGVVLMAVGYGTGIAVAATAGEDSSSLQVEEGDGESAPDVWIEPEMVPAEDMDFGDSVCADEGDGFIYCIPAEAAGESGSSGSASGEIGKEEPEESGWASALQSIAPAEILDAMLSALTAVDAHSGGTAEIVGSGGFAISLVALCLLAARPLRPVLAPLAALGSMPLSAYSAHVVSYVVIAGPGTHIDSFAVWLWSAVIGVVAATLWSMLRGRGPLEALTARVARATAGIPRK